MEISLFIPTIPEHIKYLDNILDIYLNKSSIKPDEIIVSVSNYKVIPTDVLSPMFEKNQNVKFILHDNIMLAGPNRQVSKDFCNGDIIIYQDSDDLPHIQRIEIIKHFFENYDILHLNHSYNDISEYNEDIINISEINYIDSDILNQITFPNNKLTECVDNFRGYGCFNDLLIHGGAIAIKKSVLDVIRWKNRDELYFSPGWDNINYKGAEDYEFNMESTFHLKKSMLIDSKCYFYRQ
jgi:hypothetical protein